MRNVNLLLKGIALLFLCSAPLLLSCSNEDLLSELISENTTNEPDTGSNGADEGAENPGVAVPPEGKLEINTTPCGYTLDTLDANETLAIDCRIDLKGQTIQVPANVTLQYNGGEIINGTLNFSSGGKIDSNLLNYKLEIKGDATLTDAVFQFHPERWDIVQGQTTSDIALKNTANFENLMNFTKSLGATTFVVDYFDAYFEISKVTSTTTNQNFYPSLEAINIPSDFHLKMSNNTNLRVFPNNGQAGVLIAFREVANSSITGGILHGDRDKHDYSTSSPGEGGNHLINVHAANNIIIDGVKITMGSKGGLYINALRFTFQPDYIPSHNITIRNCVFDSNRRMAVALTDGYDILFENNTFIDTALDRPNSDGGVVGFALNIEPVRKRDATTGELVWYEKVHDITLRGNTERGSRVGAFNIFVGDNIIIEDNDFENKVGWSYASNSKVRNNTFTASAKSAGTPAINAGGSGETVYNNDISGNTISGYNLAISAYHGELKILDNILKDNITGIQLKEIANTQIYNNLITSKDSSSRGINAHLTWADNILIDKNEISVAKDQLYFVSLNQESGDVDNKVTITNNKFMSDTKLTFSVADGISFKGNEVVGGLQFIDTKNVEVYGNNINADKSHGIHLRSNNFEMEIGNNTIKVPDGGSFQCIKNDSGGQISITDNVCE